MKKIILFAALFTFLSKQSSAQHAISIDAGYIKNFHNNLSGLNLSSVLHLTRKWAVAVEMNRFFPVKKEKDNEEYSLSALDFDLNIHRNFNFTEKLNFYPIIGISHTSEKEIIIKTDEAEIMNFYSFNTGAGFSFELTKKIHPSIEYTYAWGKINQQFLLVNIAYEFSLLK